MNHYIVSFIFGVLYGAISLSMFIYLLFLITAILVEDVETAWRTLPLPNYDSSEYLNLIKGDDFFEIMFTLIPHLHIRLIGYVAASLLWPLLLVFGLAIHYICRSKADITQVPPHIRSIIHWFLGGFGMIKFIP